MHFENCNKSTYPIIKAKISVLTKELRNFSKTSVQLILYQFVVPKGTLILWSFVENGSSSFAEIHFENCKKSTYPINEHVSQLRLDLRKSISESSKMRLLQKKKILFTLRREYIPTRILHVAQRKISFFCFRITQSMVKTKNNNRLFQDFQVENRYFACGPI